ncbi:hypothetical protein NPIL_390841 [Nephila pilipes]|uniref:Uncharacterized protein n=1 Tax=Nephila pilipes TaxID=299642 RepID=A0A8X6MC19_NEPPI|nr:hypothetical protein NPIL_390841 [Nephila pilipes]
MPLQMKFFSLDGLEHKPKSPWNPAIRPIPKTSITQWTLFRPLKIPLEKTTAETLSRNDPEKANELTSNYLCVQVCSSGSPQQMAPHNPDISTKLSTSPNNISDFSIFDVAKELQNLFRVFPGVLTACEKMKNSENNLDK